MANSEKKLEAFSVFFPSEARERECGFYWTNSKAYSWTVCYWEDDYWQVPGVAGLFTDEDFIEIDERSVVRPDV